MAPQDKYASIAAMIAGDSGGAPAPRVGGKPRTDGGLAIDVHSARYKYGLTADPCVNVEILKSYAAEGDGEAKRLLGQAMAACKSKQKAEEERERKQQQTNGQSGARQEAYLPAAAAQMQPPTAPPDDIDLWLRWLQVRRREPNENWVPKFKGGY